MTVANLLNTPDFGGVWIVPAGDDRYDKTPRAPAKHRLAMLKIVLETEFAGENRVRIETAQIDGKLPGSATADLLNYLERHFPEHEFVFAIGADNFSGLSSWRRYDELMREHKLVLLPRAGEKVQDSQPANLKVPAQPGWPANNYASSTIRAFLREGKCLAGVVPAPVIAYIREAGLYRQES